ncbi:chromate reductase [Halopseudomonas litoralis]|uniref:Chromate reductase n=1 Tax=Halopseudomonas litoralis TaxID=797277 RepID=A0A1H1TN37_9GAMM|nr:NADPH-dependent FMN reductase [Halopseudomonas litoralis]SDS61554.1 chromate reductase [Halopseudomonas litoralis]
MSKIQVAIVVGSNHSGSINRQYAQALARLLPVHFNVSYPQIDDLPMYSLDLEGERPASVNRFSREIAAADAVLIVTPEHNRSLPAVLKNAIDWGSKPMDKNVWRDKPVAITGTSPGAIGSALAQQHLRQIMSILGSVVLGGEAYIQFKPELITAEGDIGAASRDFLQAYMDRFVWLTEKLKG